MYQYEAKIVKVYDGDTVTAEIDLGFSVKIKQTLRLKDINAPEVCGPEKLEGKKSRDFLRDLILRKKVMIETTKLGKKEKRGKYGRYIAVVFLPGEVLVNVNNMLVHNGHAVEKVY